MVLIVIHVLDNCTPWLDFQLHSARLWTILSWCRYLFLRNSALWPLWFWCSCCWQYASSWPLRWGWGCVIQGIKLLWAVLASGVHNYRLHQSGYLDHSECISNHMQDMLSYLDGLGLFSTTTPIVLLATIKTLFLLGFHIKFVPVICALGSFNLLWVMILIVSQIPLFQWTCVPFPRIISYLSYRLGQALFQGLLYP